MPFHFNEVFDSRAFDELRPQLWSTYTKGNPAIAVQKAVTVYASAHYGASARAVEREWHSPCAVKNWYDWSHQTVKEWMKLDWWNHETFLN